MRHTWIIDGALAQSPLPSFFEIDEYSRIFTAVVVLTESHEHYPMYLEWLERRGLGVLHLPTKDFHPLDILSLLEAVVFIEEEVSRGGRVLVHCKGGVGRSSMVTVAYLLYKGSDLYNAIRHVRARVPNALENSWQVGRLEDFHQFLAVVGDPIKYYHSRNEIISNKLSRKHLSRVIEFAIRLSGLFPQDTRKISILRAAFHHDKLGMNTRHLSQREDELPEGDEIVYLAHQLDVCSNSSIAVLDAIIENRELIIKLYTEKPLDSGFHKCIEESLSRYSKKVGRRILVESLNYYDYL